MDYCSLRFHSHCFYGKEQNSKMRVTQKASGHKLACVHFSSRHWCLAEDLLHLRSHCFSRCSCHVRWLPVWYTRATFVILPHAFLRAMQSSDPKALVVCSMPMLKMGELLELLGSSFKRSYSRT